MNNGEPDFSIGGDPYYCNLTAIDFLNQIGWSRKRRKKCLRRWGYALDRQRVMLAQRADDALLMDDDL